MSRIFVCSPLRGADGQPAPKKIELARKLMKAVFDAGHAPFAPHLLYPQVLSESEADLKAAFSANYAFLDVCDEIWVYAHTLDMCSRGMRAEVEYVAKRNLSLEGRPPNLFSPILVHWMPPAFAQVQREIEVENSTGAYGTCSNCKQLRALGPSGRCYDCFCGAAAR